MKICFNELQVKNFLSFGNNLTSINLNQSPFTLILGENGSGKSTLVVDALHFALFGKVIRRGVKQSQVVNSINKKDCEVSLSFTVNAVPYKIIRGLAPNVLRFFKSGIEQDERASNVLIQKEIEELIQFDQNTFKSISVLSLNNSKAFVDLTPEETRNVIENLLGIQIYSLMLEEAKKVLKDNKDKEKILEKDFSLYKGLVEDNEKKQVIAEQMRRDFEKGKLTRIADTEKEILGSKAKIESRKHALVSLDPVSPVIPNYSELEDKKTKLIVLQKKATDKIIDLGTEIAKIEGHAKPDDTERVKLDKKIEFLDTTEICPVCEQELSDEHRAKERAKLSKELSEVEVRISAANDRKKAAVLEKQKIQPKLDEITKKISDIDATTRSLNQQFNKATGDYHTQLGQKTILEGEVQALERLVVSLQDKCDDISAETLDNVFKGLLDDETVKQYKSKFEAIKYEMTVVKQEVEMFESIKELLSDGGIKAAVVKRDLPFLNNSINQYLQTFERSYGIEFDEEFNIKIKGYAKNGLSYYNLSEGEKKRIDLAILLSFIDLSKKKNSIDINILVFDEIFDTSLDSGGQVAFTSILTRKIKAGVIDNVFIISHDRNLVLPESNIMTVYKEGEFSKVKVE